MDAQRTNKRPRDFENDIRPFVNNIKPIFQAGQEMQEPKKVDAALEGMRDHLKKLVMQNPGLDVMQIEDQRLQVIDVLTKDQLEMLQHSLKLQLGSMLDRGFSKAVANGIFKWLPGVDNEKLVEAVSNDSMFQAAWNNFLGIRVSALPDTMKLAVITGAHIFQNIRRGQSPASKQRHIEIREIGEQEGEDIEGEETGEEEGDEAPESPLSTDHMREER
jgi:hypothetical protein